MKKGILKCVVFLTTFVTALIVIGRFMNKGHDNLTMEMAEASFPLVTMLLDDVEYNQLHGYATPMNVAYQRETTTILGEGRSVEFTVDTFGRRISDISIEVRSIDGSRLIENTEITEYTENNDKIKGKIALKDLIEENTEYSLALILGLNGGKKIYYYTNAVWSDSLHAQEKLEYVLDFHERLFDREAARELTKYLETNSKLESNSSFNKVNIHSSFRQITWGELEVKQLGNPIVQLTEIAGQTASFLIDYVVSVSEEKETMYYFVEEYFRVKYTTDRMYLLDYERTMNQVPDEEKMYANDKILLGITDTDVPMMESEDGNIFAFVSAGRLFSYNYTTNKLTVIFGFYDKEDADWRTIYNHYSIKILDVDEGGNVSFAVYGYMNRGRHEGEVGIQLYTYNSGMNANEELIYIPYDKNYSVLAEELEELLYLNRVNQLYLRMNHSVYCVNLRERSYSIVLHMNVDGFLHVSDTNKIMVWPKNGEMYNSSTLNIRNLTNDNLSVVMTSEEDIILPLGFIDEDVIYGIAKKEDIVYENSGRIFCPMYKICICNATGALLKEYNQPNIYITGCRVEDNQITIERLKKNENGEYTSIYEDHIMNNAEVTVGKNKVVAADIDRYERYVQIQTRGTIDTKSIKILNPKEVVYEGGRNLKLESENPEEHRYFVYGPYGVCGIYSSSAGAINLAYDISGVVTNEKGEKIWLKGNRSTKNQIMAIKEAEVPEGSNSLAVCLDTMFQFEGLVRNSYYQLENGKTVLEILEEGLEEARVLDMSGCSMDAMLYYVNQDIPVLAMLNNGEAVLITGFNEFNTVIFEPSTGRLYKKGMNDSKEWFEENGNCFITYVRENH